MKNNKSFKLRILQQNIVVSNTESKYNKLIITILSGAEKLARARVSPSYYTCSNSVYERLLNFKNNNYLLFR